MNWTTASRSLGADAELDQVIFDGSSFGTATPAGSEEEADYLGIPGLLDAEQMRDLLRRRQEEQLDTSEPRSRRHRVEHGESVDPGRRPTGSCASYAANSTPWCRSPTIAPASRTAGSTTSCAGSAAARRSRRRRPISSRPASTRFAHCRRDFGARTDAERTYPRRNRYARATASSARCFSELSRC